MPQSLRTLVCGLALFVTASVDASPPTFAPTTGIEGWQALYDATNGASWTKCAGNRDSPCSCSEANSYGARTGTTPFGNVNCVDGLITGFRLLNLGMTGSVPADAITNMFDLGGSFFDVRENTFDAGSCATIAECTSANCLGFNYCTDAPSPSPSKSPTTAEPTPGPTSAPTAKTDFAWKLIYDNLGGPAWTKCSEDREDACGCTEAGNFGARTGTTPYASVACTSNKITAFRLVNNNLVGKLTDQMIDELYAQGQNFFDFRENEGTLDTVECIETAVTFSGTNLGFTLCTDSPTKAPTTAAPTTLTPTEVPTTEAPSKTPSFSPTNGPTKTPSDSPTTLSPTQNPNIAPSNAPTENPTMTPSNSPSEIPTFSPSEAPSDLPTQSPTAPTVVPTGAPSKSLSKMPTMAPIRTATEAPVRGGNKGTAEPTAEGSASMSSVSSIVVGIIITAVGWQM